MDDSGPKKEDERQPRPFPLPGRESGIRWTRTRPMSVEEIARALDRIEAGDGRPAPSVEELGRLVRDAFAALDIESTPEADNAARRAYLLFRDAANVEQRLAVIDEAWSRGFDDGRWPYSLFLTTIVERQPALIAVSAARYAAFVRMFPDGAWDEIGRLLACAEYESEACRAAVFLGLIAVGDPELLHEMREFRCELSDDDVATICGITLINPDLATVVFMLEWMDEAQRRNDQTQFSLLASAVARSGAVSAGAALPPAATLDAGDLRLRVCYGLQLPITREQLGRQIRPRLEALADRETGARVIPPVLEAWGLRRDGEAA